MRFRSRLLISILILFLLLPMFSSMTPVAAEDVSTLPARTKSTGSPYFIMVNCQTNTVTIYTLDKNGYYSVPYKAMICSTGRSGYETNDYIPGTHTMPSWRKRWCYMVDGSYGQYATEIKGNYLFHSVCYYRKSNSSLMDDEYNALGNRASRGCVRLQVADAKWIYDNVPAGTRVHIYESSDPGPLGKPQKAVASITSSLSNGWEPTDPDSSNPWQKKITVTTSGSLGSVTGAGTYIKTQTAKVTATPGANSVFEGWYENGKKISSSMVLTWTVTGNRTLQAVFSNKAKVTVVTSRNGRVSGAGYYTLGSTCTLAPSNGKKVAGWYNAKGTLLSSAQKYSFTANSDKTVYSLFEGDRFVDIPSNAWYLSDVMKASQLGITKGTNTIFFSPNQSFTRAMVVQMLARLENVDTSKYAPCAFSDVPQSAWYAKAVNWASSVGIVNGVGRNQFAPNSEITRQDMMTILVRFLENYKNQTLSSKKISYSDSNQIASYAKSSIQKGSQLGLIKGYPDNTIRPKGILTRAEGTTLLMRLKAIVDAIPVPTVPPTPTPSPTAAPSPSPSPSPSEVPDPTPSADPDPTPDPTPSADPDPSPDPSPSADPDPTPDPSPSADPDPTPDPSPSADPDPTPDPDPSADPGA